MKHYIKQCRETDIEIGRLLDGKMEDGDVKRFMRLVRKRDKLKEIIKRGPLGRAAPKEGRWNGDGTGCPLPGMGK